MHIFIWLCDVTRLVLASACPWHQAVGESPDVLGRYPHQSGVRTFSRRKQRGVWHDFSSCVFFCDFASVTSAHRLFLFSDNVRAAQLRSCGFSTNLAPETPLLNTRPLIPLSSQPSTRNPKP